ncbi:hypothetical protein G5B46_17335 [Caulobacter sp. 602-2]|uniref:Uncharacterized protein n=1 Tax=Caulobacter sp. 602-2 TaxID=2710887 RepID=A0A6G4R1K1_9CAUL|nr:hypothetical protein [Caulobacter sp. 602-2]NGM51375.1 hypothetical protein [Caulobacter sp. 602-2]
MLTVALMGAGFALAFLLLLFMLWSSGKSPKVRRLGELVASLLYLLGLAGQAWNTRESALADAMRLAVTICAMVLVVSIFRYFKALRSGDHADGAR